MKRILSIVLVFVMALGLSACKKEVAEEKGVATLVYEEGPVTIEMVLDAKGDEISWIHQTTYLSTEGIPEEQLVELEKQSAEIGAAYSQIKGVEHSFEKLEGKYQEKVVMEINKDTLPKLIESGLLPVTNEKATTLSVKETKKGLQEAGWTLKE